jgi:hypothetical protein
MASHKLLGTIIHDKLDKYGWTEERYRIWKGWIMGLKPQDVVCSCKNREELLNFLHKQFLLWLGVNDG